MTRITYEELSGSSGIDQALALRYDPSRRIMLRFRLDLAESADREALLYVRRAMVREQRAKGLEWDEPSIEDPTLIGSELRWYALVSQAAWCRRKVQELVERTNRIREGGPPSPSNRYQP